MVTSGKFPLFHSRNQGFPVEYFMFDGTFDSVEYFPCFDLLYTEYTFMPP